MANYCAVERFGEADASLMYLTKDWRSAKNWLLDRLTERIRVSNKNEAAARQYFEVWLDLAAFNTAGEEWDAVGQLPNKVDFMLNIVESP